MGKGCEKRRFQADLTVALQYLKGAVKKMETDFSHSLFCYDNEKQF